MPAYRAIQPAWRPITSSTITRSWLAAVVCSRSRASVAQDTALKKPNVKAVARQVVVDRLRHADDGNAVLVELLGDGQRAVAADADQAREAELLDGRLARRRPAPDRAPADR